MINGKHEKSLAIKQALRNGGRGEEVVDWGCRRSGTRQGKSGSETSSFSLTRLADCWSFSLVPTLAKAYILLLSCLGDSPFLWRWWFPLPPADSRRSKLGGTTSSPSTIELLVYLWTSTRALSGRRDAFLGGLTRSSFATALSIHRRNCHWTVVYSFSIWFVIIL